MYVHTPTIQTIAKILFRFGVTTNYVDLHPMAGDAVIFYSHIPHQGAKIGSDDPNQPRANIVLHYQQNPMFLGIRFVSNPQFTLDQLGYAGTFLF